MKVELSDAQWARILPLLPKPKAKPKGGRPDYAPLEWVERLHDRVYIQQFKEACEQGKQIFMEQDCGISKDSYETALLAVGGVMLAVDAVMGGQVDNAFCAVRPPGHHAERNRAMGFCFFNNVAIGAVYALEKYGLQRVAIIDWDVHHGNGTQHLFEEDPRVFFVSLHGDPRYCYPGTGYRQEEGKGVGKGFTLNLPLFLSGHGKDDAVPWKFLCTTGANSGFWTNLPVPSQWDVHGFGTLNYHQGFDERLRRTRPLRTRFFRARKLVGQENFSRVRRRDDRHRRETERPVRRPDASRQFLPFQIRSDAAREIRRD